MPRNEERPIEVAWDQRELIVVAEEGPNLCPRVNEPEVLIGRRRSKQIVRKFDAERLNRRVKP